MYSLLFYITLPQCYTSRNAINLSTGNPSSKYEHRRASALLRNTLQDAFSPRANQRSPISATFPVWSHRQNLGLNSACALPLKDSDTAWDSNYSHSGWETVSFSRCDFKRERLQRLATFDSLSVKMRLDARTTVCYLSGIWRQLEPLERIYGRFPSVDPSGRFAGVPNLGKPYR